MTDDRVWMMARQELIDYLVELDSIGFEDPEFRLKVQGIREVANRLEARADQIEAEKAEPTAEAYDQGWLVDFNKGER